MRPKFQINYKGHVSSTYNWTIIDKYDEGKRICEMYFYLYWVFHSNFGLLCCSGCCRFYLTESLIELQIKVIRSALKHSGIVSLGIASSTQYSQSSEGGSVAVENELIVKSLIGAPLYLC